jgi:enamine deaminase RidA (YjgF/YER057c/UK114 family)
MTYPRAITGFLTVALLATTRLNAQGAPLLTNPAGLSTPRGFSHVAEIPPGSRLLFISGQVAADSAGRPVAPGDARGQARQIFENLRLALASRGASFAHVAKLTVFLRDMKDLAAFRDVRDQYVNAQMPPASSLVQVSALVSPSYLLEIEAVAIVP